MARHILSPLQRQLTRVSRRLFLQTLLDTLVWCLAGALTLSAGWFLVQPYLFDAPPSWLRWAVAGGLVGLGVVLAVVLAVVRAPSRLIAALSLDEKFGLKERVTTSLTLTPALHASPAGQALLADVNQRIDKLDVGSRFPVRVTWTAALVPVCAAALACVAFFYEPQKGQATSGHGDPSAQAPPNAAAIEQKMKELRKKAEQRPGAKPKSEELERLEAELEKIANRPHESKEQLRERVKEMTALEETMKDREKELADKTRSLKQQLQQLDKLAQQGQQEGPASDLQKALAEGKLDKAAEEIERLTKKLEKNELSTKEKKQLEQQLQQLQKDLERLAQQKDKEEQLKQANLDPETLKRELKRLQADKKKLEAMQKLANKLGQCQKCLQEGKMDQAAQSLQEAGEATKDMELDEQALQDLRDQLTRLQDALDSSSEGLDGDMKGDPQRNNGYTENGNPVPASGRRPLGEKGPFRSFDSKAKVEFDPKGKKIFDGYAPGQNFRKKSSVEIEGEIKQATQEAPEAIEQQRIPRAYRESAKGYFRNLGGQREQEPKK